MLEVVYGILSMLADILVATRWFWTVMVLIVVVLIISVVTRSPVM